MKKITIEKLFNQINRIITITLLATIIFTTTVNGQNPPSEHLSGTLYKIGSQQRERLFRWEMDLNGNNWKQQYFDNNNHLIAEDQLFWENDIVKNYSYARYPANETARIARKNNGYEYIQTVDGKTRTATQSVEANFLVGPMVSQFIRKNWTTLTGGKTITVNYGVPEQLKAFGFDIALDTSHPENKSNMIVFKMKPASVMLRFFVDPIYFVFTKDDRYIKKIIGRTMLMVKEGNKLKPVDAELVLEKRTPIAAK
jgi:hypothetical protein